MTAVVALLLCAWAPAPVVESAPRVETGASASARPASGVRVARVAHAKKAPPKRLELDIRIDGPTTVEPGRLVKLDASQSEGEAFVWRLMQGTPDLYDVTPDGRVVYFASPVPGDYVFALAVSSNGDEEQPPLLELVEHVVTVEGASPSPPATPQTPATPPPTNPPAQPPAQPPVTPTDPLPEGKYNLARWTRDVATATVPASAKRGDASASLAIAYTTIASKAEQGQFGDAASMVASQQLINQMVLLQLGAGTTWNPWFTQLKDKLTALGLTTPAEHAIAWREIAKGLEAVK